MPDHATSPRPPGATADAPTARDGAGPVAGLAVAGVVGFLVLGALSSALGPALPVLSSRHGLDASGAALLLAAFSAGATLGAGLAGSVRGRVPDRTSLTVGATVVALGSAVLPLTTGVAGAIGCLVLVGVGFGAVDLLLNLVLAASGDGGGSLLMAVSAAFGVGAVGVPLLIGWQPGRLALPFWVCAGGALLLLALTSRLRLPAVARSRPGAARTRGGSRGTAPAVLLGAVLLGYVTLEGGVAGWETTHLRATTDASPAQAATAVALFWGGLTLGRLLAAPLVARLHPRRLLLLALGASTLGLLVAAVPGAAVPAYAATGLLLAPVFPAVVAWHTARRPDGRGVVALFAAALAGPVVTAPLTGAVIEAHGAAAIPWVLAALAAGTTALAASTRSSGALR
ncbi:MFS transporter [Kineococcus sp. SYSU DK001]|uniref:MFS transporter n=1 Tax=Kineococcus sp. SYSU DK001 TaxID=3383122 RepID=UPI003D7DA03A